MEEKKDSFSIGKKGAEEEWFNNLPPFLFSFLSPTVCQKKREECVFAAACLRLLHASPGIPDKEFRRIS